MKNNRRKTIVMFIAIVVAMTIFFIFLQARVELSPAKQFSRNIYTSTDSMLIMDRHMGYINYERFRKLVSDKCGDSSKDSIVSDSVFFKTKYPHYFFGDNVEWTKKYKNLPIHIKENEYKEIEGFFAKIKEIDSVKYVLIPYQILSNIVK